MAAGSEMMKGPRLEFVVRPIKGKVKREKHSFNDKTKKIETTIVPEDGGYLVFLPNGHSYRLTKEQFLKRGFDRQPNILNFESINDTKTPAGRYKFAMNDQQRKQAWRDMEEQVIKSCVRKHGPVAATEVVEDDSANS